MDDQVKKPSLGAMWASSQLAGANAAYVEELYESYLLDHDSVPAKWREFFDTFAAAGVGRPDVAHGPIKESFRHFEPRAVRPAAAGAKSELDVIKQVRVLQLINAYRFRGHLRANINPLNPKREDFKPLPRHELTEQDLDTVFNTGSLVGPENAALRDIIDTLERTYCSTVGAEYMHIMEPEEKRWIQDRLESAQGVPDYAADVRKRLLDRVTAAEGLERYLHMKYVGQKRFSLEGAEALIPMLDEIIQRGGAQGVKEVVIGMAHRGRLNVLINVMGKSTAELFSEFEGTVQKNGQNSGDVKYHQGFSSNIDTPGGSVHVALAFNPSHLEIVTPVVEGSVRARQDRYHDKKGDTVVPVTVHGDAAFAGQGVVMETLNMSQSRGFSTKGTVHVIVNNQIGFTTSHQRDARSTLYCTDVAKMVNAPILHVNGDDPEAVLFVTQLAFDYRMRFKKDVVIDLVCYRRHGHNEADEPWVTQPLMYKTIRDLPTTRALYAKRLVESQIITEDFEQQLVSGYKEALESGACVTDNLSAGGTRENYPFADTWLPFIDQPLEQNVKTAVDANVIADLGKQISTLPENFNVHFAVGKVLKSRDQMAKGEMPIDWGFAETMAYATLLAEGFDVRLSGQDSGRGTFFHRHAVVHEQETDEAYVPLRNLKKVKSNFLVINSLLSEEAVLAFEYGYSSILPDTLTIWEAQFGDFANGAQVVIDQFISAGEQKWGRLSSLVMMLPHGYEGQGPEHSSARLERYLQLSAQNNMQVCVPTTSAQIFHLLRRQMHMKCRKPLIIMTPKSLLRHKLAASSLKELTDGQFHNIIPETGNIRPEKVTRILFCSGKVYYDLVERRDKDGREDVAIMRMEQLYPFPHKELEQELSRYKNAREFVWCQEEPKNQGAWFTSQHHVRSVVGERGYLHYAGRDFFAAPACGYMSLHKEQLAKLLDDAFGVLDE